MEDLNDLNQENIKTIAEKDANIFNINAIYYISRWNTAEKRNFFF